MYEYGSFFYSVDKIKIKGKLNKFLSRKYGAPYRNKIRVWCECFLPDWIECVDSYDNNFNIFGYRFAYMLRVKGDKEGTFFIKEWFNGGFSGKENPDDFILEYNPNKSGSKIYDVFCKTFIFKFTDIVQFDLAYDIPGAKANDILIDTKCDIMTYGKTYNKTTYISPKEDGSGRVKIYDKRIERESQGILMEDMLRIEITIKGNEIQAFKRCIHVNDTNIDIYSRLVDRLNSVKIKTQSEDAEDWKVYALSCLTPEQFQKCLGMMSKNIRSNYKKKIESSTYYTLGLDVATLALHFLTALAPWQKRMKI